MQPYGTSFTILLSDTCRCYMAVPKGTIPEQNRTNFIAIYNRYRCRESARNAHGRFSITGHTYFGHNPDSDPHVIVQLRFQKIFGQEILSRFALRSNSRSSDCHYRIFHLQTRSRQRGIQSRRNANRSIYGRHPQSGGTQTRSGSQGRDIYIAEHIRHANQFPVSRIPYDRRNTHVP